MSVSALVFPASLFVLALEIALAVVAMSRRVPRRIQRALGLVILVAYIAVYLWRLVFSRVDVSWKPLLLLEPLRSYRAALSFDGGLHVADYTQLALIVVNWLLYVPLGCLLSFTWPERFCLQGVMRGLSRMLLVAFTCSLATEITQYSLKVGYFETDDLLANVLGACLGYLVYRFLCAAISVLRCARDRSGV